jgi:hypothetical protein
VSLGGDLVNVRAAAGVEPAIGTPVGLVPDPARLHLFDTTTGTALAAAPPPKEAPPPSPPSADPPPSPIDSGAMHERSDDQ